MSREKYDRDFAFHTTVLSSLAYGAAATRLRCRERPPIFARVTRHAAFIEGTPTADIAVYASDYSKAPWQTGGLPLADACTRRALSTYRVVVPNARQLSDDEMAAFDDYLRRGGSLYWSAESGLAGEHGARTRSDLPRFLDDRPCTVRSVRTAYVVPVLKALSDAIAPCRMATVGADDGAVNSNGDLQDQAAVVERGTAHHEYAPSRVC